MQHIKDTPYPTIRYGSTNLLIPEVVDKSFAVCTQHLGTNMSNNGLISPIIYDKLDTWVLALRGIQRVEEIKPLVVHPLDKNLNDMTMYYITLGAPYVDLSEALSIQDITAIANAPLAVKLRTIDSAINGIENLLKVTNDPLEVNLLRKIDSTIEGLEELLKSGEESLSKLDPKYRDSLCFYLGENCSSLNQNCSSLKEKLLMIRQVFCSYLEECCSSLEIKLPMITQIRQACSQNSTHLTLQANGVNKVPCVIQLLSSLENLTLEVGPEPWATSFSTLTSLREIMDLPNLREIHIAGNEGVRCLAKSDEDQDYWLQGLPGLERIVIDTPDLEASVLLSDRIRRELRVNGTIDRVEIINSASRRGMTPEFV